MAEGLVADPQDLGGGGPDLLASGAAAASASAAFEVGGGGDDPGFLGFGQDQAEQFDDVVDGDVGEPGAAEFFAPGVDLDAGDLVQGGVGPAGAPLPYHLNRQVPRHLPPKGATDVARRTAWTAARMAARITMRITMRVAGVLILRGRDPNGGPGRCQVRTVDCLSQAGLQRVAHPDGSGEDTWTYDPVRIDCQDVADALAAQFLQGHLGVRIGPTSTANMIDLDVLDSQGQPGVDGLLLSADPQAPTRCRPEPDGHPPGRPGHRVPGTTLGRRPVHVRGDGRP